MTKKKMPIHRELESAKTYFRKKNKEERSKYFSEVFQRNGDFWDLKENSTKSDQENLIRDYEQRNPGFKSQNVPDDGNCFYHALKLGLESHGIRPGDVNDIRNRLLSTIDNDIDGILDVYASSHKKMTLEEIQQEDPSVQNPTAKMNSHNDINSYKDTGRIVIDYETKDNIKAGINSNRVGSNAWGGIYEACIAAKAYGVNINFHDERVNALGEKEWIATKFLGDKANLANSINIGTQFQGMKHIVYYSPINKKDNNKKISRSDNGFDKSTEEQAAAKSKTLNALKNQNDTPTLATKIAETIIENHGILKDKAIINSVEFADAIKSSDSLTVEDRKEFEPLFKQMQGKIYSKEELVSLVAKSKFVSKQVMATEQVEQIMLKNKQKQSSNYTPNHVISNARSR